jgi:hypothetical protein|tara:strand:+ start:167 stop:379 length:213 start_codon:yes stop_codon:yes gene_type:complete
MPEESNTSTCLALIQSKLDRIHEDVAKNSEDIISLKEQVAMGKGGLRAIFIVGALIGLILTSFTLFKEMF